MSKKIIVFGSMNMDFSIACDEIPKQGETIQGDHLVISQGGKGANQALAAKKLQADVKMIGCVGDDSFANLLVKNLQDNGICTKDILKADNKSSGMALILRIDNDNRIIINHGSNHHIKKDEITKTLNRLYQSKEIKPKDIFICQLECDKEAIFSALKQAKEYGLYTIFNPAPAKKLNESVFEYIDLFILNQSESEFYTGICANDESSAKECIEKLLSFGVNEVILTLSSNGSAYKSKSSELKTYKAYKVNTIDTTAAGDTYIGGVAAALSKNLSIDEAIDLGSKAAAVSTLKIGAQASIPTIDEINQFFKDSK